MHRSGRVALALVLVFLLGWQVAWAQSFPSLPSFPKLPSLPSIPGLSPGSGGESSPSGTAAAVAAFCAAAGAGGIYLGKQLAERDAKKLKLSPAQKKSRERSYMLGGGLFGCAVGGGVAANVINKMSAESKKAQEDAWNKAQQQTGPVTWQGPDAKGTTEIVERESLPDGGECGTRRDVIEAEEGRAEPMARVCRTAGATDWKPVTSVS